MSIAPCPGSAFAGEDPQRLSKLPGAGRLKMAGDSPATEGFFCHRKIPQGLASGKHLPSGTWWFNGI